MSQDTNATEFVVRRTIDPDQIKPGVLSGILRHVSGEVIEGPVIMTDEEITTVEVPEAYAQIFEVQTGMNGYTTHAPNLSL